MGCSAVTQASREAIAQYLPSVATCSCVCVGVRFVRDSYRGQSGDLSVIFSPTSKASLPLSLLAVSLFFCIPSPQQLLLPTTSKKAIPFPLVSTFISRDVAVSNPKSLTLPP